MGDVLDGETIATNDIHATEIVLKKVQVDGNDYTIDYQVTLWDHFGLDMTDIEAKPNSYAYAKEAFAAWFTLQHLRGYRPFITRITFDKSFKGNIHEGEFERVKARYKK